MNKPLYITSFNKKLYDVSGKNLLESFKQYNIEGDLFIGVEQLEVDIINKELQNSRQNSSLLSYNLSQNEFLNNWLLQYADIIPQYLGGKAKPCNCSNPESRLDRDHLKGCYFSWWNRNCSRWFRKIALLHYLYKQPNTLSSYDSLIWIDADCVFKRDLSYAFIRQNCFRDCDIFFMRGQKRPVIETGIFGIKLNSAGRFFIGRLIDKYTSGDFKGYCRWDDGYIFDKVRTQYASRVKGFDIGYNSFSIEVADECQLSPYIQHFKGRHGRIMNIMK